MEISCTGYGGEFVGEESKAVSPAMTASIRKLVHSYQRKKESLTATPSGENEHDFVVYKSTVDTIHALRSNYWSKIFCMTCAYEHLPVQEHEWWNQRLVARRDSYAHMCCNYLHLPEFDTKTVLDFVARVYEHRPIALAKRVDGVFTALCSRSLSTDRDGFLSVLEINQLFNEVGLVDIRKVGAINALRCLTSDLLKVSPQPLLVDSAKIIRRAKKTPGCWVEIDGGRMKLRVSERAEAKISIDVDAAQRLNAAYFSAVTENLQ